VDPSRVHVRSGTLTVVDPPANRIHLVSTSGETRGSLGVSSIWIWTEATCLPCTWMGKHGADSR
jgi:hypothetical protein